MDVADEPHLVRIALAADDAELVNATGHDGRRRAPPSIRHPLRTGSRRARTRVGRERHPPSSPTPPSCSTRASDRSRWRPHWRTSAGRNCVRVPHTRARVAGPRARAVRRDRSGPRRAPRTRPATPQRRTAAPDHDRASPRRLGLADRLRTAVVRLVADGLTNREGRRAPVRIAAHCQQPSSPRIHQAGGDIQGGTCPGRQRARRPTLSRRAGTPSDRVFPRCGPPSLNRYNRRMVVARAPSLPVASENAARWNPHQASPSTAPAFTHQEHSRVGSGDPESFCMRTSAARRPRRDPGTAPLAECGARDFGRQPLSCLRTPADLHAEAVRRRAAALLLRCMHEGRGSATAGQSALLFAREGGSGRRRDSRLLKSSQMTLSTP